MSYRRMIFSSIVIWVLFLLSCNQEATSTPINTPETAIKTDVSGPALFLAEKSKPSINLPDIHILIDDSNSMTNKIQGNGEVCDATSARDKIAYFLYQVIDYWKNNGYVNSDQKTLVWLLDKHNNRYSKDLSMPNLLSWLNQENRGSSPFHGLVEIFSSLKKSVSNNSVVIFITDGDFRNGHPDTSWRVNAKSVVESVSELHDNQIDTHFLLLCPNRLVDADLDGIGDSNLDSNDSDDYAMLSEWNSKIRGRGGFVYGIDTDDSNNVLPEQKHFTEKKADILQDVLSQVLLRYDAFNEVRLFTIENNDEIRSSLEAGIIPQRLKDSFAQHGLSLTESAKVHFVNNNDSLEWKIEDTVSYFIRDKQQVFDIYSTINWKIITAGNEYEESRIPPYTLFLELNTIPYEIGDSYITQLDKSAQVPPSYLFPIDSNNCNLTHEIKLYNIQSVALLQWYFQPLSFFTHQEGIPITFYNNQAGLVTLKTNDKFIFEGELWKNCIKVGLDFDLDTKPDTDNEDSFLQFEENELGELSLTINDALIGGLYTEQKLNLIFYWDDMDGFPWIQIAEPVMMAYKRIHYPVFNQPASIVEGRIILPYGYIPDIVYPEDYQPSLYFKSTCDIYKPNGYKPLGSPHSIGQSDLYFIRENNRYIVVLPENISPTTCHNFEIRWDNWPYESTDELYMNRVLHCSLTWGDKILYSIMCNEEKE